MFFGGIMLILVLGGSGSGKSAFAEALTMSFGGTRAYIATMEPFGEEGKQRVKRHRALRQGKGFETLEVYRDLDGALAESLVQKADTVLLECMLNLLANETFSPSVPGDPVPRMERDILALKNAATNLIVITGEVFSDGESYPPETARYIRDLATLNRFLAERSDLVIKSTVGIPIALKGNLSCFAGLFESKERGILK